MMLSSIIKGEKTRKVQGKSKANGTTNTYSGKTTDNVQHQSVEARKCEGSYKGGKFSYKETYTKYTIVYIYKDGSKLNCSVDTPFVYATMEGSFTASKAATGNFRIARFAIKCGQGISVYTNSAKGTWTGTVFSEPV